MKKTTRKIFSIVLTVLMLMSVMSIQSFAALDFLRAPTITSVEMSENSFDSVSLKEVKTFFDEMEESLKEMEEIYGETIDFDALSEELKEMLYSFYLGYSNLDYEFVVTLSNGEKYTVKAADGYVDVNAFVTVEIDALVLYDDYLAAVEDDADTVKVTFKGNVYSNVLQDYTEAGAYTAETEIDLISCVVESIKPVSGVSSTVYEDADYMDIDGAKFRIKYADGSTKTAEVTQTISMENVVYYPSVKYELDGNPLYAGEYDGEAYFTYLDAEYSMKVKYAENPFESIEITNCVFDYETGLQSIDYTITWKNGNSEDFTKEFTAEKAVDFYGAIDCVDGYVIMLSPYYSAEEDPEESELKLTICVCAGEMMSEPVEYEIPYSDTISLMVTIAEKLSAIVDFFRNLISVLIGMITGA